MSTLIERLKEMRTKVEYIVHVERADFDGVELTALHDVLSDAIAALETTREYTHCGAGHPLTPDNLDPWWATRGFKHCKICIQEVAAHGFVRSLPSENADG